MLILTRKTGQGVTIQPNHEVDPAITIAELFAAGPIEIVVKQIRGNQVKLGIQAHQGFMVLRDGYRPRQDKQKHPDADAITPPRVDGDD